MVATLTVRRELRDRLRSWRSGKETDSDVLARVLVLAEKQAFYDDLRRIEDDPDQFQWVDIKDLDWDD